MGRHSKLAADRRHRRAARIPAQRRPGIEVVDVETLVTHQVSDEALIAGRGRGRLEALCGAQLQAASLVRAGPGLLRGVCAVSPDPVSALAADFGRASACFTRGEPDRMLVILLPGLGEAALAQRVQRLVAIGALIVSVCGEAEGGSLTPAGALADLLMAAATDHDAAAIRDAMSACAPMELVDVLVARFAASRSVPSPRGTR